MKKCCCQTTHTHKKKPQVIKLILNINENKKEVKYFDLKSLLGKTKKKHEL